MCIRDRYYYYKPKQSGESDIMDVLLPFFAQYYNEWSVLHMSENGNQSREWNSRFGYIMVAAGAAIGLGNIWKFAYLAL